MKSIAGMVRIAGFVMSLLVCSIGVSMASGEVVSDTRSQSTAWDADIVLPVITQEQVSAPAEIPVARTSFGGNGGNINTNTSSQAKKTTVALVAQPPYTCGQGFAGRVISSNPNNASVLIRLSDLNSRTVINLHPHVDSDGDYRQGIDYLDPSSMFYVPAGNYQVLIVAYHGSTTDSVVFDSYIGTDCPSHDDDDDTVIDPWYAWDDNLGGYQSDSNITDQAANPANNSNNKPGTYTKPKTHTKTPTQSDTTHTITAANDDALDTSAQTNNINSNTASDTSDSTTLDTGLTNSNKDKNKDDDRYKWLIAAALGGSLIYYGAKKK